MKLVPLLSCVGGVLVATSLLAAATPAPAPVGFDWFEYSGRDADAAAPAPGHFRNPILSGFYPDPSVCQVGRDYYLINSTFAYFPGIPIFHSRDLVNWKQIGHVIDRPQQLPYAKLGVSRAIFAPAITHHDGTFYVTCTMIDAGGNFVMTAKNPAGPWSDPIWVQFEGIDPSLFFDDDGRAWMVNNGAPAEKPRYDGHRAIWIQEYDVAASKMKGPRTVLVNGGVDLSTKPIWIEGPHLYKRDGWYYLSCAEGGTGPGHSQVVFRSRQVEGPYVAWEKNPILTQRDLDPTAPGAVTCTGHANLVAGPDGRWWAVFLGVRPYQGQFSPMGRETFLLPVEWTADGWPAILPAGERVPLTARTPGGVAVQPSSVLPETGGSFTWRDDFSGASLSPLWIMLRTPGEPWWMLGGSHGQLELTPRNELLSGRSNPSFLGRRVQHATFTASTAVEVPPTPGVSAGLAVFQNEHHHYFFAVKHDGEGAALYVEKHSGAAPEVIGTARLPAKTDRVTLRVEAHGPTCDFSYAVKPGAWETIVTGADAKLLTSAVAGGFVGATVGVHARIDPAQP